MKSQSEIIEEGSKMYLVVAVPDNIYYAMLSASGTSFVYRTIKDKTRLLSDDNPITGYVNTKLSVPVLKKKRGEMRRMFHHKDVFSFKFKSGI